MCCGREGEKVLKKIFFVGEVWIFFGIKLYIYCNILILEFYVYRRKFKKILVLFFFNLKNSNCNEKEINWKNMYDLKSV